MTENNKISIFDNIQDESELLRHLSLEDKERLNAIDLSFQVEVIISTQNQECNAYGMEIYKFLKLRRSDLQLEGYQFGMPAQNQRFDIIPQGENLIHVYVPVPGCR